MNMIWLLECVNNEIRIYILTQRRWENCDINYLHIQYSFSYTKTDEKGIYVIKGKTKHIALKGIVCDLIRRVLKFVAEDPFNNNLL